MDKTELLHFFLFVVLFFVVFAIGFVLGKISSNTGVIQYKESKPKSFFDKEKEDSQEKSGAPSIDSSKFVVNIKTDGMEKKYNSLGETKVSNENISNSISKLKNMKG